MSAEKTANDIVRHNSRYRSDSLGSLSVLMLGLVILIAILVMFAFLEIGTRPSPKYFKLNDNLQIIEPVPLDQEGISKAALLNWISEMIINAFSYNYSNQHKQQAKMTEYFSDSAMQLYLNYLQTDQDLSAVAENKYVVAVRMTSAPEIITGKEYKGRYAWQIRVPMQLRFANALNRSTQDLTMDILVWRVPETESALGITIGSFTTKTTARTGMQSIKRGF